LRNVPVGPVRTFVSAFRNHDLSLYTDPGPIGNYIDGGSEAELAAWDVLFAGVGTPGEAGDAASLGLPIHPQTRAAGERSDASTLRIGNKQRVASRGIERTGLSAETVAAVEAEYRASQGLEGTSVRNYPDWIYREKRTRPLLVVHVLNINERAGKLMHSEPVVAWSIAFPGSQREEKRVEYVVTRTWMRENYRDEIGDEEFESDDD
jgi:hypothetical protein